MPYSPDNLSREEMLIWAAEHFPGVKIRSRVSTNKKAEARDKKTGELLAAETSMFKLREVMKTDAFKAKLKRAQAGLDSRQLYFKGKDIKWIITN